MKERREIPIIEHPDMQSGLMYCSACDGMGATAGIQQFAIKTSETGRQTIALCKECSEKIALFLLRAWEN